MTATTMSAVMAGSLRVTAEPVGDGALELSVQSKPTRDDAHGIELARLHIAASCQRAVARLDPPTAAECIVITREHDGLRVELLQRDKAHDDDSGERR